MQAGTEAPCPQQGTSRPPGTPQGKGRDPPPSGPSGSLSSTFQPQDPERTSCRFKSPGLWWSVVVTAEEMDVMYNFIPCNTGRLGK